MSAAQPRLLPTPEQMRSADPSRSVWVTANAGTGKTRVLSNRILRLLLSGARPESILAITFTKAAAAEMIARVETVLAHWATMPDDDALALELEDLCGEPAKPERLRQARRLFAQILDLPKGLPIMTIHALSTALLRRFPIEAGVAPHFETIDDRTASEMMIEAREEILTLAQQDAGSSLAAALNVLATSLTETSLTSAIQEMLDRRIRLEQAQARAGGATELIAGIYRRLEIDPRQEPADLIARACRDGEYDADGLARLAIALRAGSKTQMSAATTIAAWLSMAPGDRIRSLETVYKPNFLRKTDGRAREDLLTKKFRDAYPAETLAYDREQGRIAEVFARIRGLLIARRTEALLRVGFAAIQSYERQKARKAALDFEDLIERARALLASPDRTEWVLFKLDERIAHILVDEAQDTSPAQWDLVERLSEDFFAGEGAHGRERTLFVVGDEKQSIYSFQGADLANFRNVRDRLSARAQAAGMPIHQESIQRSFRSSRAVLELVDAIYADPEVRQGVADPSADIRHETQRLNDAGEVELWPLVEPDDKESQDGEEESWPMPGVRPEPHEANRRLADAVADRIKDWLDKKERFAHSGKPIRPGDILILLQQRGTVQDLLVRSLKRRNVPVAGADRLGLVSHIAVADLLALGNAMLLPEDDLTLSCLLKSPIMGFNEDPPQRWGLDEEEIFALAEGREKASLLERLRAFAGQRGGRYAQAYERLHEWLRRADFMPPYEFFVRVLGEDGGRRRLLARLGADALEPLEAFLGQALAYEEGHPASLQGFVYWLRQDERQIKRDPEQSQDAVRVMTVHGSKGLEAPIVILADAGPRQNRSHGHLVWDIETGLPFWRPSKIDCEEVTEAAIANHEAATRDERRRLLYVALTRARDRLYITGWQTRRASGERSWHGIVETAMKTMPETSSRPLSWAGRSDASAIRLTRGAPIGASETDAAAPALAVTDVLPAWLQTASQPELPRFGPLTPSHLVDDEPSGRQAGENGSSPMLGLKRGLLIHTLLALLPSLPTTERSEACALWLERRAAELPADERSYIASAALGIIERADLAAIFAEDAFVEQPIIGTVDGMAVSGQIDRMAIGPSEIVLVDFKTGAAPRGGVPPRRYLRQMASYKALVSQIHPAKAIRCALVWTDTGTVSWLT